MVYVPNPIDATEPVDSVLASTMASEFRALKGYIQTLITGGATFASSGGFRNKLANGAFNIAQRGTSVTVLVNTGAYTLDQWLLFPSGSNATAVQLTTGAPRSNNNYIQLTQDPGGTSLGLLNRVESFNCRDLVAGAQVTISGFYNTNSLAAADPVISLQCPSSQDNWTTVVNAAPGESFAIVPVAVSVWQYFSYTFTLAIDATVGIGPIFTFAGGLGTAEVFFADIQLETGAYASVFEIRPPALELSICQRYYQLGDVFLAGYATINITVGGSENAQTTMRGIPNILSVAASNNNISGFTVANLVPDGNMRYFGTTTVAGGYIISATYILTAEL